MSPSSTQSRSGPKIGIALGSGSARGWAHIGVIKGLAELGIEPDIVAGTSIGALVGAAYANDQLDLLEQWALSLNWKELVSYLDMGVAGGGVIEGEKLLDFFSKHVNHSDIESMPKKFAAVATDLDTGREIWLQTGSVLHAVRASIALPGLFRPFKLNDRWLVDGGLVDPVPVSLCRAMGADIVIAVNLNGDIVGKHSQNRTIQTQTQTKPKRSNPHTGTKFMVSLKCVWNQVSMASYLSCWVIIRKHRDCLKSWLVLSILCRTELLAVAWPEIHRKSHCHLACLNWA